MAPIEEYCAAKGGKTRVCDVEVAGNVVAPPSDVAKLNVGAAFHFWEVRRPF
ncbi:hypothetical protein CCACVL1_27913 [Corchorus capsularis]|uniref:Uncharacterized protein n=1 Tax=Corchorus capsularis TaxID=210143 RepID=A0A1R3G8A9_COCAP|nr:hypothetical protein CCACVL1_27913 [Corchorus capsularis]